LSLHDPNEELTLDLFRRGVHAIVSREIDSEMFVECLRTIASGEPWLEKHAVKWVLDAYRIQRTRPHAARSKSATHSQRVADCFLRHPGNEEQRNRRPRGHDPNKWSKIICAKSMTNWALRAGLSLHFTA